MFMTQRKERFMNCFLSARFSRFPLQLLILFCVIGQGSWLFGQSKANREVASDDERLAGKVYDGLAAFAVHRDGILRKRRCLFVEGERYLVGKQSEPQVHPLYYIQVIDRSKRFEYVANGFVNLPGSMGKSYQTQ